jgi:hypothetical protein
MASKFNYRLVAKVVDSESKQVGKVKMGGRNCHETKSMAGRLFQSPSVISVLVADITGKRYFYAVKTFADGKTGHVIQEKTENIPSAQALFG